MDKIGIELEEAQSIIRRNVLPVTDIETVEVLHAGGRILAEDVYAVVDQPPFPRSPLDGYAFCSRDVADASEEAPAALLVKARVCAGEWYSQAVERGEAVRIMTGAPMPEGTDCVIRQEEVKRDGDLVLIPHPMKAYENYCFQGEDVKAGTLLVEHGSRLNYIEQGILAAAGYDRVSVYRHPRVALFDTGDELVQAGEPLRPGKIYDANLQLLYGRLEELGFRPVIAGALGDDPEEVAKAIRQAAPQVDLVITTGGVSVGEKDIFHQVLPILGAERLFWRIHIKPGTPAMFALFQEVPMIHLSGNPFAALATFELLAKPALAELTGDWHLRERREKAVLATGFKKAGRRRFLRGHLENGKVTLPPTGMHASGVLSSMRGCNCLVDVPPASKPLEAGDPVDVILL